MGINRDASDEGAVRQEDSSGRPLNPKDLTLLQVHYLGQLERLINLKESYQADPGREEWLLKAINKAAYSSFRSCIEHDAEAEANALLGREHQAN